METKRQNKIAKLIQKDLAEVLQIDIHKNGIKNLIISVSKVHVTSDLSLAKVFVSVFPNQKVEPVIKSLNQNSKLIKHEIAKRVKNQLRKMPDLLFYNDDTLDYIEKLNKELKSGDNPIK